MTPYQPTQDELRAAFSGMWRTRLSGITFEQVLARRDLRICLVNRARAIRAQLEVQAGRTLPRQADLLERSPC